MLDGAAPADRCGTPYWVPVFGSAGWVFAPAGVPVDDCDACGDTGRESLASFPLTGGPEAPGAAVG